MFQINFHKVVVRHFHIADIFEKNLSHVNKFK